MDLNRHGPEHELLLAELLAGGLVPDEARVRALLEACTTCREEALALSGLRSRLERAAREERSTLAAVLAEPAAEEGREATRVRAILEELALREPHVLSAAEASFAGEAAPGANGQPRPWRRFTIGLALLAASLLVALWLTRENHEGRRTREPFLLGGTEVELLEPVGTREGLRYPPFRWAASLAPGACFVVVVLDAEGRELVRSPALEAPRWEAPLELPSAIRWRVIVRGPAGDERSSEERSASLAPR